MREINNLLYVGALAISDDMLSSWISSKSGITGISTNININNEEERHIYERDMI